MSTVAIELRTTPLVAVLLLGVAAMAMRSVGTWSWAVPVLAAAGVLFTQPRVSSRSHWLLVTGAGVAAFTVVRAALPGSPVHATALGLFASAAAGVAEEIVFRRGLYGALERWGVPVAIVVSSLVFGLVHAPMYGWPVVPVDVGAGLVLGWQRWASGTWTSSAVTHVAANLLGAF